VDVISGASAGALTGAMLFHYIGTNFYRTKTPAGDRLTFVKANFDAWCGADLSFAKLLGRASRDGDKSFLSNGVIEDLAKKALTCEEPKLPDKQNRLIYTCTVTGLKPISFEIELPDATRRDQMTTVYGQTRKDWMTFYITHREQVPASMMRENDRYSNLAYRHDDTVFMELASTPSLESTSRENLETLWNRLRFSCMASGAFPLAWSPVTLTRNLRYYPQPTRGEASDLDEGAFTYMDGGVINNMPLDRAATVIRNYALTTDVTAGITDRTYLLIDVSPAHLPAPKQPLAGGEEPRRERKTPMFSEVPPLVEAVREQSFYTDLLEAQHTNERLRHREQYLWPVLRRVVKSLDEAALTREIAEATTSLLALVRQRRHIANDDDARAFAGSMQHQFRLCHSDQLDGLKRREAELFVLSVVIGDLVADLTGKHRLHALRIQPTKVLKSAFFGDFGGFVDQKLMRDDFWHGMQTTRAALTEWVTALLPEVERTQGRIELDTDILFCSFDDFVKATGLSDLTREQAELYYRPDDGAILRWEDAPPASQKSFLTNLGGRLNTLVAGKGLLLYGGLRFFASPAAWLLCAGSFALGIFSIAATGKWLWGLIAAVAFGVAVPLTIATIFARPLWKWVEIHLPKAK
jgi:predicted acylesterase/phospholipase RssA